MWLILTLIHGFTMALVNYLDEYLTHNNSVEESDNIHKRIWGVFLTSMLFWIISVLTIGWLIDDFSMTSRGFYISIFSAIPMIITFGAYFYLFQKFPAHQIVPLFWLSSFWLLMMELLSGATIWIFPLIGIFILICWSYLLDTWSFSWKIPTKLLWFMIPVTFLWSFNLFLVRIVSQMDSTLNMFFYQYVAITIIGILLLCFAVPYRQGFCDRLKKQWKSFFWWSIIAESIAQVSFLSSFLAISLATLATYVSAVSSIQYIFLFLLFFLFPLHKRNTILPMQIFSIFLMIIWIFLIEFFK